MVLVLELVAHDLRDHRADAAELRMAEGIARARLRHELALGGEQPLGHADANVAVPLHQRVDPR